MKQLILITTLISNIAIFGAAENKRSDSTYIESTYIINNSRKPLYIRARTNTPARPKGAEGILRLSKDKSIRVVHNRMNGPLRVRVWPEEFGKMQIAGELEQFAYEGFLIGTGNVTVLTSQKALAGLSDALKSQYGYSLVASALKPEAQNPSGESLGIISLNAENIDLFKDRLFAIMSKWSSIKFDSKYATEQTLTNAGTFFAPAGQENVGPQLDTIGLEAIDAWAKEEAKR